MFQLEIQKKIIAGATIFINGAAKGAATDFNGNYEIKMSLKANI